MTIIYQGDNAEVVKAIDKLINCACEWAGWGEDMNEGWCSQDEVDDKERHMNAAKDYLFDLLGMTHDQ